MRKIDLKKSLLGFKPELHWELIIGGTLISVLCVAAYSIYLFAFANQQIHMEVATPAVVAPTAATTKIFTSSEQMQELFDVYKSRQNTYDKTLSGLVSTVKKVVATTTASSSTSTKAKIATSTNQ